MVRFFLVGIGIGLALVTTTECIVNNLERS